MSREIKFRVRDLDNSHVVLGYEALVDGHWKWCGTHDTRWYSGNQGMFTAERVVREQFTGLKDKNGTKVYEGDIVRLVSAFGVHLQNSDGTWVSEVAFNNFGFSPMSDQDLDEDDIEVIGNIFSNPELLK